VRIDAGGRAARGALLLKALPAGGIARTTRQPTGAELDQTDRARRRATTRCIVEPPVKRGRSTLGAEIGGPSVRRSAALRVFDATERSSAPAFYPVAWLGCCRIGRFPGQEFSPAGSTLLWACTTRRSCLPPPRCPHPPVRLTLSCPAELAASRPRQLRTGGADRPSVRSCSVTTGRPTRPLIELDWRWRRRSLLSFASRRPH
jgi:hypothetical protein